jgi:hypothetical protein
LPRPFVRCTSPTSYDLLLYWASAKGPDGFDGICDFFWAGERRDAFDAETIRMRPKNRKTRMYFLHGALHVVVLGDGTTCKRRASADLKLLDQFGHPFHGDHTARPLIVTEASDANKRRSIKSNDYLNYCWERLKEVDCPMVVFGHSLSDEDTHLAEAVNAHPRRPVAVSLVDGGRDVNRDEQLRITRKLRTAELHFFDAATHPLGSEHLAVPAL